MRVFCVFWTVAMSIWVLMQIQSAKAPSSTLGVMVVRICYRRRGTLPCVKITMVDRRACANASTMELCDCDRVMRVRIVHNRSRTRRTQALISTVNQLSHIARGVRTIFNPCFE